MPSSRLRIAVAESVKRAWSVRLCVSREASMLAIGASSLRRRQRREPRARGLEGLQPGDLGRQPQHLAQVPGDAEQQHQQDQAVEDRVVAEGAEQDGRQHGGDDEHRHQEYRHADQIDVGSGHGDWLLAPVVRSPAHCRPSPPGPRGRALGRRRRRRARARRCGTSSRHRPSARCAPPGRATAKDGARWRDRPACRRHRPPR